MVVGHLQLLRIVLLFAVLITACIGLQGRPRKGYHINVPTIANQLASPWQKEKSKLSLVKSSSSIFSQKATRAKHSLRAIIRGRRDIVPFLPDRKLSVTNAIFLINMAAYFFTLKRPLHIAKYMKDNFRIGQGEWYRLMTCLFLHGNLQHIAINSLSLLKIGPQVIGLIRESDCFRSSSYLFLY
jgi:hypothetical protein